jgi:EAL domain-containing protein (putative c-di-GMP-specific phosphodiesterase class I)/CheY-like chemotaxis protein
MQAADLRFLVVEDHGFQRWELSRQLADLGAKHVFEAQDGLTALEIFQNLTEPIDVIVTDLDMPRMDGMEFIRHIGEVGYPVSVILTSALERSLLASVATMAEAYGIKLLGTIEKPPSAKKLAALIEQHQPAQEPQRSHGAHAAMQIEEIAEGLRKGEFEAFFQPKVSLATGRLCGAEALARWRHPKQGIIPPFAFMKAIEAGPLIDELTWVMLRMASQAHAEWRKTGVAVPVSVNLSAASLTDTALADKVTNLVREHGMAPRDMVLEVTESAATTNIGRALENLSRLRMKGFGLSIDDYGTGYSSMQQLTRVAFTELKIDQSFVRNIPTVGAARVVLESSLEMARKLNLTSVAEGVETRGDWDLLRELGCDHAQGYFVAIPMDAAAFMHWAQRWSASKEAKLAGSSS